MHKAAVCVDHRLDWNYYNRLIKYRRKLSVNIDRNGIDAKRSGERTQAVMFSRANPSLSLGITWLLSQDLGRLTTCLIWFLIWFWARLFQIREHLQSTYFTLPCAVGNFKIWIDYRYALMIRFIMMKSPNAGCLTNNNGTPYLNSLFNIFLFLCLLQIAVYKLLNFRN